MGTIPLSEFREDLQYDLLDRDDLSAAWLNRRINQTYAHVCFPSVYPHREMQTTYDITLVQTQEVYQLDPATVGYQIHSIRDVYYLEAAPVSVLATTQKSKLDPRGIRWFDNRTLNEGSQPRIYAIDGEGLHIEPLPDASVAGNTLRLRVWAEPEALALDGDTTIIPAIWDEVIGLGARWRAEMRLGYRDRAELTKQDYAALLNEYKERQDMEMEDTGWAIEVLHGDSSMEMR
jgi:hypothetical protein